MSDYHEVRHELSVAELEAQQRPHVSVQRCKECRREIFKEEVDGVEIFRHWDPAIDFPGNAAFHFAELEVEPYMSSQLSTGWTRL